MLCRFYCFIYVFFFNDTATTEIYTLSLHDALPIFMNLSGYINGFSSIENDIEDSWNFSGTFETGYTADKAVDENWTSSATRNYANNGASYIYENYTIDNNTFDSLDWTAKYSISSYFNEGIYLKLECFNYSSSSWITLYFNNTVGESPPFNETSSIPNECFSQSPLQLKTTVVKGQLVNWARSYYYEGTLVLKNDSFPKEPYIQINNTKIWNHTGEFNSTFSPNQTSDFASILNTALNNGACDCIGCSISGSNCLMETIFHSDTAGILEYSSIDILYDNKGNNETLNLINYFSGWDYSFPSYVDWLEFIPNFWNSKNVTPYRQTATTPILNITFQNYGNKNANLSVYLNETDSCVNLTVGTNSTKSAGTQLTNNTWTDLLTDKPYLNSSGLWMWADYSCNQSYWSVWSPEFSFRTCGVDVDFCSTDLA